MFETLMTLWLFNGAVLELGTSAKACMLAEQVLAADGAIIIDVPNAAPLIAVEVQCTCPASDNGVPL